MKLLDQPHLHLLLRCYSLL